VILRHPAVVPAAVREDHVVRPELRAIAEQIDDRAVGAVGALVVVEVVGKAELREQRLDVVVGAVEDGYFGGRGAHAQLVRGARDIRKLAGADGDGVRRLERALADLQGVGAARKVEEVVRAVDARLDGLGERRAVAAGAAHGHGRTRDEDALARRADASLEAAEPRAGIAALGGLAGRERVVGRQRVARGQVVVGLGHLRVAGLGNVGGRDLAGLRRVTCIAVQV
jgi:hypothetical protein